MALSTTAGPPDTIVVGGVRASRATRQEMAVQMLADVARARRGEIAHPLIVTYLNGDVLARYHSDPPFRAMIDQADVIDVDGMPLVMATHLFCKEPVRERVATTDFVLDASAAAAAEGVRFFFLGAKPGVSARAAETLRQQFPGLSVVGVHHGYFAEDEAPALCDAIVAAKTDILWLGLGSPRQEKFAIEHRARLGGLAWIRTCGGLFDHYAGGLSRAPRWVQKIGFEWLYRTMLEPGRLGRRYLVTNPQALYHLATKTHD